MFSGIVEEVGEIVAIKALADGARLQIRAPLTCQDAKMGESIAVLGVCLTVVDFDEDTFHVEAVAETLRRTRLGALAVGSCVNLEKSLRLGDRVGGHLVTGHVDALARISSILIEGISWNIIFELDSKWSAYFADKGSVAIDGISLTVAECAPHKSAQPFWFRVALIPHTLDVTTLGKAQVGDTVNIETDVMARYVVRLSGQALASPEENQHG
jgi:riboflavin synthase